MIKLNLENLFKISGDHSLSQGEIDREISLIPTFLKSIDAQDQGFYKTLDDDKLLDNIESFSENAKGAYDHIIVLGIGGSALGTICLQQSLKHLFEDELKTSPKYPRLHIIDNIDPVLIKELQEILDPKRTLFIVVTKSGVTPETVAQYFYFYNFLRNSGITEPSKQFVFITDPEKGLLRKIAQEEGIISFEIPQNVGGRFSVLTAVGLLPAALTGINIRELIEGAREMRDTFLTDLKDNLPFTIATIQYLLYKKGKSINVLMPYSQKLIKFSDWYRQLLAESIGKKIDRHGKEVNVGITPVNSLGATDQHSQTQLYNEGPNDKLHIFFKVKKFTSADDELVIPNLHGDEESVSYFKNISFSKLIHTELQGTMEALTQNNRPNILIELDQIDGRNLGALIMMFEAATAFLGEFFEINAFDQPGVELSKIITKQLLQNGNYTNPVANS